VVTYYHVAGETFDRHLFELSAEVLALQSPHCSRARNTINACASFVTAIKSSASKQSRSSVLAASKKARSRERCDERLLEASSYRRLMTSEPSIQTVRSTRQPGPRMSGGKSARLIEEQHRDPNMLLSGDALAEQAHVGAFRRTTSGRVARGGLLHRLGGLQVDRPRHGDTSAAVLLGEAKQQQPPECARFLPRPAWPALSKRAAPRAAAHRSNSQQTRPRAAAPVQTREWPTTVPDDPFRPPAAARRASALATSGSLVGLDSRQPFASALAPGSIGRLGSSRTTGSQPEGGAVRCLAT
jgi:hypothetical protein